MKTLKKIGIWMDHANAHLIEFTDEVKPTQTISVDFDNQDKEETLQRSESEMHNKQQQKQLAFYKKLGANITDFDEVVLFGPTEAKTELLNLLRKDHQFDNIKIEVLNADKLSEKQQYEFVNEYFKKFEVKTL